MSRPRFWQRVADAVVWLALAALAVLAFHALSGCGGGAIATHARAASIATIALAGADDLAETTALAAVAACPDEPCLATVARTTAAIDAGIATVALALSAYVQAITLAQAAGESADLLGALVTAALRIAREWSELAPLYAPLGVDLPALPAFDLGEP